MRLERCASLVNIEEYLISQTAGNKTLAELSLRVDVGIELVRIARQIGIVTVSDWTILDTRRPRTRDNGLERPNLAILKGIRGLAKIIRKPSGERKLVKRMNPIGRVIKFPVVVGIHLLHCVVSAHAELDWNHVGLFVWEMIVFTGELYRFTINGEEMAGYVIVRSHLGQLFGVPRGNRPELRMAVAPLAGDLRYFYIVDHP